MSIQNNATGLNLTAGGATEHFASGRDSKTWLFKAGWLADLVSIGKTASSVDYYNVSDVRMDGDEGQSVGLCRAEF